MSQHSLKKFGFTLIELLVVISIIALLLGILVPVLGKAKEAANFTKEVANLSSVHKGFVTYGASNKDWFPGVTASGKFSTGAYQGEFYSATAASVHASTTAFASTIKEDHDVAIAIGLEDNTIAPGILISTKETDTTIVAVVPDQVQGTLSPITAGSNGLVTNKNHSYAYLAFGGNAGLKTEWKSNQNGQAVSMASRMELDATGAKFSSTWTEDLSGKYKGVVVTNDSSAKTVIFANALLTATAGPEEFVGLKYGSKVFTSSGVAGTTRASIFGSASSASSAANFGATANRGQIGSANDAPND